LVSNATFQSVLRSCFACQNRYFERLGVGHVTAITSGVELNVKGKFLLLFCCYCSTLQHCLGLNVAQLRGRSTSPLAFHASRRATRFYSRYRLRTTWWAPEKSKDIVARARSFRVRLSWRRIEAPTRSSAIGTEVSAERHKSACRSTAGEDQQALRICGSEGRRWLQACSTRYGCSARAMPTRLWAAGCSQPCHGVCVAD
jgi:hypothetical protein